MRRSRRGDRADLPAAVDPRDGPDRPDPRQVMDDALDGMRAGRLDRPHRRRRRPPEDAQGRRRDGRRRLHLLHDRPLRPRRRPRRRLRRADPPRQVRRRRRRGRLVRASTQGKSITLSTGTTIELDEQACLRAAVKYGRAIEPRAARWPTTSRRSTSGRASDYEIELSVDETEQPTTLAEHYIIADQCLARGMKLVSLAPRYIGDFEKGVDYKGDVAALERSLRDHAAIAETARPVQAEPAFGLGQALDVPRPRPRRRRAGSTSRRPARATWKPSGSSPATTRRSSAGSSTSPGAGTTRTRRPITSRPRSPRPRRRRRSPTRPSWSGSTWRTGPTCRAGRGFTSPGRQILHCTFGSTLTDPELGPAVRQVLEAHTDTYTEVLADHFSRHLEALRAGL